MSLGRAVNHCNITEFRQYPRKKENKHDWRMETSSAEATCMLVLILISRARRNRAKVGRGSKKEFTACDWKELGEMSHQEASRLLEADLPLIAELQPSNESLQKLNPSLELVARKAINEEIDHDENQKRS